MQALLNPGDEVIIPAPYWVSYLDMARLAGAEPVLARTDVSQRYKTSPEQLRGAISPKSRLLILNSPSNPTGVCYSDDELEDFGAILTEHPEIVIASDDIYEHILWTGQPFKNILNGCPVLHDRTVVLNGVSKAYAMTGWRIGFAAGPETIVAAMKKIQSQSTSNPSSISQAAAVAALSGSQTLVTRRCKTYKQRHDFVVNSLNSIDGINAIEGDGTFYTFPDMSGIIEQRDDISNDVELAEFLLEHASVAAVPGSAFGSPGCMRFSFATSMEILEQALANITRALSR